MKKHVILFLALIILASCNSRKANDNEAEAKENVISQAPPAESYQDPLLRADSLVSILPTMPDDTNKVNHYWEILDAYINYGIPSKALPFIKPGIELAEKLEFNRVQMLISSGRVHWKLGEHDTALKYHLEALALTNKEEQPDRYGTLQVFIGQDYADAGNYSEALKYFFKAREYAIETGDIINQANALNLISWVYTQEGNFVESSKYNLEALHLFELTGDKNGVGIMLGNLGDDCREMEQFDQAMHYFRQALVMQEKDGNFVNIAGVHLGMAKTHIMQDFYDLAFQEIDSAFKYSIPLDDFNMMGECYTMKGNLERQRSNYSLAAEYYLQAIDLYKRANSLHETIQAYSFLTICYIRLNNKELAKETMDSTELYAGKLQTKALMVHYYQSRQLYDSLMENWLGAYNNIYTYINLQDSIKNSDINKKLLQNQVRYEFDKKEEAARVEQEKKDIKQRNIRNIIIIMFVTSLIFLTVVSRQRNKISKARKRSDELLLNILPEEVAEELKAKGSANAKQFNEVTVMFTDFKGFTQISERLTPSELVAEIHTCYKAFDDIITKHNIEKIKTVGDSYMCAGGLPVENNTNPEDVVKAALEIQQFMQTYREERRKSGKEVFEVRVGVHTGPVVAGIVGVKKFAYDIWGDTVNIASRMESSGEAGKVNISGATYALVKDKFKCIHRGKIPAKNKGEIDMYFVEAIS